MADRPPQQEYWDANLDAHNLGGSVSDSPESLLEELKFSSIPDIEHMIAHLEPAPGLCILEIGTGLGANGALVRNYGATVIALDLSHERLATLKARTNRIGGTSRGKILPVKARAEALPFRDESLDGVYTRAVLIHTDIPQTCAEVARTLKPGAPMAFSEPMAYNPLVKLYRMTLAPKEWRGITRYFAKDEIAVAGGNFDGVQVRRYYGLAFLAFFFQYAVSSPVWFYRALRVMMKLDVGLEWLVPGFDRYSWFVLITGRKPGSGATQLNDKSLSLINKSLPLGDKSLSLGNRSLPLGAPASRRLMPWRTDALMHRRSFFGGPTVSAFPALLACPLAFKPAGRQRSQEVHSQEVPCTDYFTLGPSNL